MARGAILAVGTLLACQANAGTICSGYVLTSVGWRAEIDSKQACNFDVRTAAAKKILQTCGVADFEIGTPGQLGDCQVTADVLMHAVKSGPLKGRWIDQVLAVERLQDRSASPGIAQKKSSNSLPDQFIGCYKTAAGSGDGTVCRQPTPAEMKDRRSCPGGGILIDANRWTTFEDWTCDIKAVASRRDGIIVDQVCGGEGHSERVREFWQVHSVADMTLLVKTDAKSLKSEILVRCLDK